jgi:hypothetical protein
MLQRPGQRATVGPPSPGGGCGRARNGEAMVSCVPAPLVPWMHSAQNGATTPAPAIGSRTQAAERRPDRARQQAWRRRRRRRRYSCSPEREHAVGALEFGVASRLAHAQDAVVIFRAVLELQLLDAATHRQRSVCQNHRARVLETSGCIRCTAQLVTPPVLRYTAEREDERRHNLLPCTARAVLSAPPAAAAVLIQARGRARTCAARPGPARVSPSPCLASPGSRRPRSR